MNLSELIINDIKPVEVNQKILLVQQMFNNLTYSHIPISSNQSFIGCISGNDTHCFDSEMSIDDCKYAIDLFFVYDTANWLDVLEAFAQNNTNVMPVMSKNSYIGYYELKDIIGLFDQTPFFYEPGAVLIIRKGLKEYSFSEVSQIVESNNAKILSSYITDTKNKERINVSLKLNIDNLNAVKQTFERYNYLVSAHYQPSDIKTDNTLNDRYDSLMRYLNP